MHKTRIVRTVGTVLLLGVLSTPTATFAGRRRAAPPRLDVETLSIIFVSRTSGTRGAESIDLGEVAHHEQSPVRPRDWLTAREVVGVRIDRSPPSRAVGTGTLRAWLPAPDPRSVVRVAGVQLTALPQVIEPRHRIGSTVSYLIEVDVRATADEGTILNGIEWEVTEN